MGGNLCLRENGSFSMFVLVSIAVVALAVFDLLSIDWIRVLLLPGVVTKASTTYDDVLMIAVVLRRRRIGHSTGRAILIMIMMMMMMIGGFPIESATLPLCCTNVLYIKLYNMMKIQLGLILLRLNGFVFTITRFFVYFSTDTYIPTVIIFYLYLCQSAYVSRVRDRVRVRVRVCQSIIL